MESLTSLREAEELVVSAVESAGAAFQALSAAESGGAQDASAHSERFIKDLYSANRLVRARIAQLTSDHPFENPTLSRLIEADLAVQRTAHIHRALVRALRRVADADPKDAPKGPAGAVTEELLDSSGMTPPAAQSPVDAIMAPAPGALADARMSLGL